MFNRIGFLIDGFPIDIEQGRKFEAEIIPVDCILFLNVDETTMIERLYHRSKMAKKSPEKITVVCDKIKAFRDFQKSMYENYSTKIEKINAKEDADAVRRKAAIKINDLIIKHFTMKILRNNNLIITE